MVLSYQLLFLHSVCVLFRVGAPRAGTVSLGLCRVLCWVMRMCLLALPDGQRLQGNIFLYYFHTSFYEWGVVGGRVKDIFGRASVCCFVLSHGKQSIQGN